MSAVKGDFRAMHELLAAWNISELWEHLQAEGINIEELKLMKPHHMSELLQNYKLGVRIRFEHHFEIWRRELNKPLLPRCSAKCAPHYQQCTCLTSTATSASVPAPLAVPSRRQSTRATNTHIIEFCDAATTTCQTPPPLPSQDMPPVIMHEMPKLTPQPTPEAMELQVAIPTVATSAPPQLPSISPHPPVAPPRPLHLQDNLNHVPLSLMAILTSAGTKGASILHYYEQYRELTNTHRALLLSIIVNFFDDNDYHLSLNISHHLEAEILRLFPTEKLEYYRTEKRGKIYVKFCNMKRYRRDRPIIKRKWLQVISQARDNLPAEGCLEQPGDDDEFLLGLDNWPPDQMQIKTEEFSEDDFK